ncbi:MAG: hypothetical protein II961_03000 [Candidatus Riflebacteria bacterium]|nr:hypothetical protein [Candidatus Riflebacteria bacterium]
MLFVKRTLPLLITFVSGIIMIMAFFCGPALPRIKSLEEIFPQWIQIIMTFTMILGAFSLLRFNFQKIARKQNGWGYSVVLLVGFFGMAILGMISGSWPELDKEVKEGNAYKLLADNKLSDEDVRVELITLTKEGAKIATVCRVDANANPTEKDKDGNAITFKVSADRLKSNFKSKVTILQQVMFEGVFKSAQSTMFALLAFFVASASFRAFRIKSKEAGLLMFSAFIVMLGNVPLGNMISNILAYIPLIGKYLDIAAIKEWIISYPSSAAQSAILIGAMLGYISSSLKIIFGVERSHLGGEG